MTSAARARLDPRAPRSALRLEAAELGPIAAVLATATLPVRLPPGAMRSLRWPLALAAAGVAAAGAMALAVVAELARAAWGSGPVAAALIVAALVGPPARLVLGGSPSLAVALRRCAPLLRALDLGGAPLARIGALAVALPAIAPTAALGTAAATVLAARGAAAASLAVVAAIVVGAVATAPLALRAGARLAAGVAGPTVRATSGRRLAIVAVLTAALLAMPLEAAQLWSSVLPAAPPMPVAAAAIAIAAWIAADGLVVDARPWLRLQATLVDCGASAALAAARSAAAGVTASAAVGVVVGSGAGMLVGTDAGLRAGLAAMSIASAVLVVLVLEPDPRAVLARSVAVALAAAPAASALLSGASTAWLIAAPIVVAALGVAVLVRRIT